MIGLPDFAGVFGAVPAGELESTNGGRSPLVATALAAVRTGFAVVLLKPGGKQPLCPLRPAAAKRADREAREDAARRGDPKAGSRRHACGLAHAFTTEAQLRNALKYLMTGGEPPNLGVELGASRYVVVDVDTAAEDAAFKDHWTKVSGLPKLATQPTVRSPGATNDAGEWVHKDGGHYWFALPAGVELPADTGAYKHPAGFTVYWANRQVLVPPSVRPEGPYTLVGQSEVAPGWLVSMIQDAAQNRLERRLKQADKFLDVLDPIEIWSNETSWAELLEPAGWEDTGNISNCGCPEWAAPGAHHSRKSATAHELGCDQYDTSTGWGPLHVWTDNPPDYLAEEISRTGRKTVTKLHFAALLGHDGDDGAAMGALGLSAAAAVDDSGLDFDLGYGAPASMPAMSPLELVDSFSTDISEDPDEDELDDEDAEPDEPAATDIWSQFFGSEELDDIPDPEPLIDQMLDLDTFSRVIGKSGHGKTFVTLDMALCVATGTEWKGHAVHQGPVIYMVAEGARGIKKRIQAWERRHLAPGGRVPKEQFGVLVMPVQVNDKLRWGQWLAGVAQRRPVLVVMDTQARITVGVNENDNTEMGKVVERMEQLRRATHGCVLLVHHLGHNGDQGRGASAMLGAVNSELRVTKDVTGAIVVHTDKQKDSPEARPVVMRLEPDGNSAVLVPEEVGLELVGMDEDTPLTERVLAGIRECFPGASFTVKELRTALANHGITIGKSQFYLAWAVLQESGSDGSPAPVVATAQYGHFRLNNLPNEDHLGLDDMS